MFFKRIVHHFDRFLRANRIDKRQKVYPHRPFKQFREILFRVSKFLRRIFQGQRLGVMVVDVIDELCRQGMYWVLLVKVAKPIQLDDFIQKQVGKRAIGRRKADQPRNRRIYRTPCRRTGSRQAREGCGDKGCAFTMRNKLFQRKLCQTI